MSLCFEQHTAGTQWTVSGMPMMTAVLSRCLRGKCAHVVHISSSIRDEMPSHPGQLAARCKVNALLCITALILYPHCQLGQTSRKFALSREYKNMLFSFQLVKCAVFLWFSQIYTKTIQIKVYLTLLECLPFRMQYWLHLHFLYIFTYFDFKFVLYFLKAPLHRTQQILLWFSIIGSLNAAWAFTLWERPWACRLSEACIESRQFIGWWRNAAPDVLTSSAYTGERVRHLLLRFFCLHEAAILALLLRFFWPNNNFSDTDSPFALRWLHTAELCSPRGEVPWNIAVVNRRVLDLSDVELEAMESEQTGLAFSLPSACTWILRLNSRMIICILAWRHVTPSPLG